MVISYSHQNWQRQVELEEITLKFDNVLSVENQIVFPFLFYFFNSYFKSPSVITKSNHSLLLLLLLSRFSRVRLCATPWTAAHEAPPSLGFSRQEHWSGLPLPSPMHESEKWKWSRSVISDSSRPHGLQPTRLLCPWDIPGKNTGVGCHCLLQITPITSLFLFILRQSN